jgi:hypothetical protein
MNQIPQSLIESGAIITMPDGYRALVADAQFNGHLLWWFEVFGEEHILEATTLVQNGTWLHAVNKSGAVATIGEMEGWDDSTIWDAWKKFLDTDEGRATAASIADLKSQAAKAKE